jgi:DNA polymerase II small subunit/DNA polymerase delta subunit B
MENLKDLGISKRQLERIIRGRKPRIRILKKNFSDDILRIGIVSDTHLCSVQEKLNELHTFYGIMKKEGITDVVNAGDVVCGWGIYKGQENEVHTFGARNQANYVIEHYPKVKGVTTHFITGNHDQSWWNRSGVDIGELVSAKREDMVYLGQYEGNINFGGVKVRLLHPDGGGAYAISYSMQKRIESMVPGNKPDVYIEGHDHTMAYLFMRNVHGIRAGCFEGQTSFLLRKGKQPQVGGWTAEIRTGRDKKKTVLSLRATWIPFL